MFFRVASLTQHSKAKSCAYSTVYIVLYMVIDSPHKSHNAVNKYPTVNYLVTEICTHVHISFRNGALWDLGLSNTIGCETAALWDLQDRSIRTYSWHIHVCSTLISLLPVRLWWTVIHECPLDKLLIILYIKGLGSRQPCIQFHWCGVMKYNYVISVAFLDQSC